MGMTAAERKREQRIRQDQAIWEQDSSEWSEAVCLRVLADPRWKGGAMGEAAWRRLGEIQGYL
jgi:hypothetical protein